MTKQQVIDILEAYKPSGNIYNGYNSIEEKVDEKICSLIDDIIESVKREPDDDWIKCSEKIPENGKNVLVVIKENGYTGVMYGNSSLVILDENGKEVFHTGSRTCNTYEELVEQVDTYPELRAMLENFFKKEVKK